MLNVSQEKNVSLVIQLHNYSGRKFPDTKANHLARSSEASLFASPFTRVLVAECENRSFNYARYKEGWQRRKPRSDGSRHSNPSVTNRWRRKCPLLLKATTVQSDDRHWLRRIH
ncbi:hypothetical protein AVEN_107277-1 [Araneus ventricosus]|uniref:Uncharacterized protein n=1 Tax=Araneus ventricosus TaxID=182803 RepID=A0A4Y2DTI0_ARAVE|nr:hypothetical protein AVEN_107277-1 [Araneus ventricosus]